MADSNFSIGQEHVFGVNASPGMLTMTDIQDLPVFCRRSPIATTRPREYVKAWPLFVSAELRRSLRLLAHVRSEKGRPHKKRNQSGGPEMMTMSTSALL